jgi:hypothetical protein
MSKPAESPTSQPIDSRARKLTAESIQTEKAPARQTRIRQPYHIFTSSTVIVSPSIFPLTVTFFP